MPFLDLLITSEESQGGETCIRVYPQATWDFSLLDPGPTWPGYEAKAWELDSTHVDWSMDRYHWTHWTEFGT